MLATDDRQLLQELVRPPEGFTFSEGIVTTYSLDLLSLLMVPLHFTTIEYQSGQRDGKPDPLALLSALQDNVDRLSIYCQAGQIAVPAHQQRLFGYLEPTVIEVTAPRPGGVFHPKVWILRYTDGETICYRLGVFSRNLTADRCWDTALVLEGDLMDRKVGYSSNAPLAEFVEALPGMAIRTLGSAAAERAQRFAAELRKVNFDFPEPFKEFGFWPLGHQGKRTRPFDFAGRRGVLVSPFVSESVLEQFADSCGEATLISRAEALDAVPPATLAKFQSIKVMADAVSAEAAEEDTAKKQPPLSGLHAKLFVMEQGMQGVVFVGSANATHAAMNQNVEFMVELAGGRSSCGVDALLGGEVSPNAFGTLLQDYTPPADGPVPESAEQRLERLLSREATQWAGQLTGLRAEPVGQGTWSLSIAGAIPEPAESGPAISATCRPLTLSEASAQPLTRPAPGVAARFAEISEEALTSFLVVSLKAQEGQVEVVKEFVLNLPLEGGPPDRRGGIVRAILRDRRSVMRFLMMLLSDVEAVLLGDLDVNRDGKGNGNGSAQHARVLLEPLLRALHREPDRLDRIDRLMAELASPEDAERLPVGWDEIWAPIWAERQRARP